MRRGFRVWDETKKQYDEIHTYFLSQEGTLWSWSTLLDDEHLQGLPENLFIVEFDTGLKDKNGKKIHDGDIVNVIGIGIAQVIDSPTGEWMLYYRREPNEINSGFVSVVPKNKPSGLWKTNTTSYIEVIGNIHENPELLEGEK